MTSKELAYHCKQFGPGDSEQFAQLVHGSFGLLGMFQRDLAKEFEVAESTVSRWAKGTARPHPRIQKLVIAWLGKRATRAAMAQAAGVPPVGRAMPLTAMKVG